VLLALSLPAAAERYALLVGVSRYPHLTGVDLRGPKNDVQLMHATLTARGFRPENVIVVADGVPSHLKPAIPTRRNILESFDRVVARLGPGDFLYVHFAGHGAQQPEREAGQEEDGLDEVFLAQDASRWDDAGRTVTGAITDNELGALLDRAAERGATTWIVYDSCHAGTMTRAMGSTPRRLLPAQLGIPAAAANAATAYESRRPATGPARPRSAAFFASLPHAPTGEYRRSWLDGATVYGQFTYVIAEGLNAFPGMTYRQLGQFVLQRYGTLEGASGGIPYFEGDLDLPVFGSGEATRVRQWPVQQADKALAIRAGALSLFSEGALFALVKDPRASVAEAIGYARVTSLSRHHALLAPVAAYGKPQPTVADATAAGVHARLVDPNLNFTASVSVRAVNSRTGRESRPDERAAALLQSVARAESRGPSLRLVTGAADIELWVADSKVHVRAAGAPLVLAGPDATLSLSLPPASASLAERERFRAALLQHVHRAAKTMNLLRVAQQQSNDTAGLRTALLVRRAGGGEAERVPSDGIPRLHPGDTLFVEIENLGRHPVDVTVLGVDARHEFVALFPDGAGGTNRVVPRDRPKRIPANGIVLQADAFGVERLIVLAAVQPARAGVGEGASDFSYLAEDAPAKGSATRGSRGPGAALLARAAGLDGGDERRGDDSPDDPVSLNVFSWRTMPPGAGGGRRSPP
jgi:hypothetical protein